MDESEDKQASSRFNSAIETLKAISFLKYLASEEFRKGNLDSWFYEWKNIKFYLVGKFITKDKKGNIVKNDLIYLDKLEQKISLFLGKKVRSDAQNKVLCSLIERYLLFIQFKIEEWGMGLVDNKDETHFA